ncbi:glycogenin glucosyltransferase glg1 [Homalodisca vitripennis]|nr:glycogenin glucosyltransferase glg1 [Homalodisca vitripennis]
MLSVSSTLFTEITLSQSWVDRYCLRCSRFLLLRCLRLEVSVFIACVGIPMSQYCPVWSERPVLECLEEKKKNLSATCHQKVFFIELQDLTDSSTDYTLLLTCKPMIRLFCQQYDKSQALMCLKKYKDEVSFDNKCRLLVMRRMIEQTSDYRFNPLLAIGCRMDIDKFCNHIVDHQPRDQELQGKVIKCLKVCNIALILILTVWPMIYRPCFYSLSALIGPQSLH